MVLSIKKPPIKMGCFKKNNMDLLPRYTHIVNPKLKHIYLSFNDKGDLIIKSPDVPQKRIEQLLIKKSAWINKSRQNFQEKKGKILDFRNTLELYYRGKAYPVKLNKHHQKRIKFSFDGEIFSLFYQDYDEVLFQKHIDAFYKKEAKECIPQYVKKWAEIMQLAPHKISFRKTKRQWGSCSAKNDLSFNTMMMKLPPYVMEYIVVHELAHIKHKHHQKAFWQLVQSYFPKYRTAIKELKTYTT